MVTVLQLGPNTDGFLSPLERAFVVIESASKSLEASKDEISSWSSGRSPRYRHIGSSEPVSQLRERRLATNFLECDISVSPISTSAMNNALVVPSRPNLQDFLCSNVAYLTHMKRQDRRVSPTVTVRGEKALECSLNIDVITGGTQGDTKGFDRSIGFVNMGNPSSVEYTCAKSHGRKPISNRSFRGAVGDIKIQPYVVKLPRARQHPNPPQLRIHATRERLNVVDRETPLASDYLPHGRTRPRLGIAGNHSSGKAFGSPTSSTVPIIRNPGCRATKGC
ncbi:hypothetical protein FFLO_06483 [Filobasidium floriforme]|uniref:Uncharacterized protein n=1 Tax=Filobasidium floriforme TaxID=5210 RepID=A0A8K0NM36_9TREE|nr:uncharacterized protein HD553DRAFT_327258 [Filobasidium floriforme]KAG7527966.1 hypothetical protein FFLO_06483 [Filobasidium floriforme]KAH8077663.1 hypothetical protein HD553DRAFT_327258 [Filobasidium floriforme]